MKKDESRQQWMSRVLEGIVETSRDHLLITDPEGYIQLVGDSSYDMYGIGKEQLLGKNVIELEKEKVFSPSVTRKVMDTKTPQTMMQEIPGGRKLMVTAYPLWNEDGSMHSVISYSHDLTEIMELKRRYESLTEQLKQFETEIEELREKNQEGFVAVSQPMRDIDRLIKKVAMVDSTVLILGESGVGKNVIASQIHRHSRRSAGQFVEINCGSIPEGLLESELFGYEAGAFTGAGKQGKQGIIELANQGTLLLDELGELPLTLQAKLLKVIQEKRLQRVGSMQYRDVDFRLIAATNRDLEKMVKEGKFRQDLYFRLNVVPIHVPALRNRPEDIAALLKLVVRSLNERYGMNKKLDAAATHALMHYDWPGNVRELENVLERLVVTADEEVITSQHLPAEIKAAGEEQTAMEPSVAAAKMSLRDAMEQVEEKWLRHAAERCRTTAEMAEFLGISQPSVVRKLQKYHIRPR
ncbi:MULTISPECIES: sigma-54-dependent Fis family transcriptional regulator [Brevibacillus]|uniref:HTH-type transcriptional regulatory protein TyrR n=1 Tax=Brevibacillus parabrevis TaxID=54914 RepID=A0A4Y3PGJ2_BREPA|nr:MULTISPECIES: sigma 54-interacting transcriptional regulator [Brevibacillus]NRQ55190.1 sigma 54-interacting transcriptional regulator [Brevibacillus sp. HD1.4A]RNB97519.1 AAA family ATPase [Brevibacillus parabrevis]GEB33610.1 RNA polymerase subunit sigma-54 [Brevibacillus parabrevis]